MGSIHRLTGRLDTSPRGFDLYPGGGAHWVLNFPWLMGWRVRRHVGRRITVEGVRTGFNELDVKVLQIP